jgi:tRNA(His) 5'-end guanylyltransferase
MIDPKPNLSLAAIQCNLDYYRSLSAKASEAYRESLAEETYWLIKLRELEHEQRKDQAR